ncbi:MAG TPA: FAD-binding oxidoreductase [Candidatus Limnocylindrales bacterium]|nr:FAD-binding oxidoreductase [Candidatus Limnocylindrales bacterium]
MTPSVAVIGGGVVGLSTAWHLVERGVTHVTVLETREIASGSSSRSAGFIETQYVDPLDIELRARSMHTFRRLQRDHGLQIKEIGYLRLAPDDAALASFAESQRIQREHGIDDNEVLDPDGVRRLVPWLAGDAIAGGLFGPRDGRIEGPEYCRLLAGLVSAGGGTVREGVRVRSASRTTSGWRLETTDDVVEAEVVVNAAGPWAPQVAGSLGVDVPVIPLRNQIGIWQLTRPLDRVLPMVMDYIPHSGTRGLYVATYDDADHVLAGLHSEEVVGARVDPDSYDRDADPDYLADTRAALLRRMPDMPLGEVQRAWAGLYPVSPDGLPIVGPANGDASVILAVGGGGSGIQMSPVMGALAADWIAFGEPRGLSDGRLVTADRDSLARSSTARR